MTRLNLHMPALLPFVALFALAPNGSSQVGIDDRLGAAYLKLGTETNLYLLIEGTESTEVGTRKMVTHVYWNYDGTGTMVMARIQVVAFVDDVLVHRVVGTGDVLYDYDVANKQYSATNYGGFGTARSNRYVRDMLYTVDKYAKGQEQYGTRLLRELFADSQAQYKSWVPGALGRLLPQGGVRDPFLGTRVYTGTPTTDYLQYITTKRAITFELQDDAPSNDYRLKSIFFSELQPQGNRTRLTEWHLTPYRGVAFDATNFEPFAYDVTRRWKIVTGPQPFKG